jgi:hypothetical protein
MLPPSRSHRYASVTARSHNVAEEQKGCSQEWHEPPTTVYHHCFHMPSLISWQLSFFSLFGIVGRVFAWLCRAPGRQRVSPCVPSPDAVAVCAARTLFHHPPTSRLLFNFRANIAVCELHIAIMLGNSVIRYLQNPCIPGK